MPYRFLDAGDTAVTVEFGDGVDPVFLAAVAALDRSVQLAMAAGQLHGVVETVPRAEAPRIAPSRQCRKLRGAL